MSARLGACIRELPLDIAKPFTAGLAAQLRGQLPSRDPRGPPEPAESEPPDAHEPFNSEYSPARSESTFDDTASISGSIHSQDLMSIDFEDDVFET